MADFLLFDEGANEFLNNGIPATCRFLLSTKSVGATSPFAATDTLTGSQSGELATGTGYARKNQAKPAAAARALAFALMQWDTVAATDWPNNVRSIVLVTTADNTGKMICAWNLQVGGAPRDMSGANTTEKATPTLQL